MSLALLCIAFALVGCSSQIGGEELTPPTPPSIITTIPPTLTPRPSETPVSPSPSSQPTVLPVDGITATRVNVRAEPSTASAVLGIIPADMRVEIIGTDPGENWWQILYPQAADPGGKGWVTAQYIRTPILPDVPIIGGAGPDQSNQNLAVVQEQINIRSGPGTDFNSIGTLNAQDTVKLTGKDANGTWLQIEFGVGPDGKGWVNAAFVQATGVESLPIVTESGVVVGTGTPTSIALLPTPTIVPAREDNDSPTNPITNIAFDPAGTHISIYNGDVSAPEGDAQDWVQFTPFSQAVLLEVSCEGNDVKIEVLQNGREIPQPEALQCGRRQVLPAEPNLPVLIRFSAQSDGLLAYTSYTLYIETIP
ncbi:MAG TPA: SH3 domain-containing protein [Anaerolineales bacterium]|nr:SH3 domain-containing protein [Anaerolineales bacterium]